MQSNELSHKFPEGGGICERCKKVEQIINNSKIYYHVLGNNAPLRSKHSKYGFGLIRRPIMKSNIPEEDAPPCSAMCFEDLLK